MRLMAVLVLVLSAGCAVFAMSPSAFGRMQQDVARRNDVLRSAALTALLARERATAVTSARWMDGWAPVEPVEALAVCFRHLPVTSLRLKERTLNGQKRPAEDLAVEPGAFERFHCKNDERVVAVTRADGSAAWLVKDDPGVQWARGPRGWLRILTQEQITSRSTVWVRLACNRMPGPEPEPSLTVLDGLPIEDRWLVVAVERLDYRCTDETY